MAKESILEVAGFVIAELPMDEEEGEVGDIEICDWSVETGWE